MRLLVTRPEPDASEMAERLRGLGHEVLVQPMMRIEFLPEPADLEKPVAVVVTSRNAARALARWPTVDGWRGIAVYAVGRATASLVKELGFTDLHVGTGDVKALADLVRGDVDPASGTILYVAARHRAADLAVMLDAHAVKTVEAYRSVAARRLDPIVAAAVRQGGIDGVILLSRRTAAIFVDLVRKAGVAAGLGGTRFFVVSVAAAAPLSGVGSAGIKIAPRPEEKSLVALIPRAR